MKRNFLASLFFSVFLFQCTQKNQNSDNKTDNSIIGINDYATTLSEDGLETFILMHNNMGIRIEYNLTKQNLSLWISPQAGKEISYKYRNFSNRDDHTSIFDKINFPFLSINDFIMCDYDPFHSIIYFKDQTLHIANLLDKPVVMIWTNKPEVVDFKTDQNDAVQERSLKTFSANHISKNETLQFVASLGDGTGNFEHQKEIDEGRSTYARAHLSSQQTLFISGELKKENIAEYTKILTQKNRDNLLIDNEINISKALETGKIKVRDEELQKLIDINRRIILSAQDKGGAIRAAIKYIYYLIWHMDGAITTASTSYTGWVDPLSLWTKFEILNPTEQNHPPFGKFYGQLVEGKITKREEYGIFYTIWSAFTHWTMTGDTTFISGVYLENLEAAVDWLERSCWDDSLKAFGFYYTGENPMWGSNDFGGDAAKGSFGPKKPYVPNYYKDTIIRNYAMQYNLQAYNNYLMLAAMTKGEKSVSYFTKAKTMEQFFQKLRENGLEKPSPGYVKLKGENGYVMINPERPGGSYSSKFCYFNPDYKYFSERGEYEFYNPHPHPEGLFGVTYFSKITQIDNEFISSEILVDSIMKTLPEIIRPGKYLPMPYTMVEVIGAKDGDPYHDVRPQLFTIGPFLSAVSSQAVRRLPFEIALRSNELITKIENYNFKNCLIDIDFEGKGEIEKILIDGSPLKHTLQIPESYINSKTKNINVYLGKSQKKPCLISSTIKLKTTDEGVGEVLYLIEGYGKNLLVFKNTEGIYSILKENSNIPFVLKNYKGFDFVQFDGLGEFKVRLKL